MQRTIRLVAVLATLLAAAPAESLLLARSKKKPAVRKPAQVSLSATVVNDPATASLVRRGSSGGGVLRAQVLLDRARFSPGEIDAAFGGNVEKAIAGFQKAHGVEATAVVDAATWKLLNSDAAPVLAPYTITAEEAAGPFLEIPEDMMEKSKLPALGYRSSLEALAEKFHTSPKLLTRLNPGKTLSTAGEEILVPSVRSSAPPKAAKVTVDASDKTVSAWDAADKLVAQYPATTGSEHDPLPVGSWKINGVSKNPTFHYNPDLFWDADESHAKAKIPAGPNNPVGVVWIDLSKPHYGIHGTPEPSTIGKTQSHGCIRLTNWDAAELAQMVAPGTPAVLEE
ncbi:MAG: L,D-transpeptidase [Acidobacteriota bacterium]